MILKSNLVIQTAFLGDLILSIPVLKRIKEIFPEDKLIVVCRNGLGDFLIKEHLADEVFEIEKSNSKSYNEALTQLNKFSIKNIFCIHRSIRSQLFTAKIKADNKIGFSSFLGFWVFDEMVPFRTSYPEVIRQFAILETTDVLTHTEINSQDFTYLNNNILPPVPAFFSFQSNSKRESWNNKIAIFPGSVWATKKWTTTGFVELSNLLIKKGYEVNLLGGPTEKKLCEEIAAKTNGAIVLAGSLSLAETIKSLKNFRLVISNDSAPTHMAVYNNRPVVTIFGPTTLKQGFRPWSDSAAIVENNSLSCRPCGQHGHNKCPLNHHNCMGLITAGDVLLKVEKILATS